MISIENKKFLYSQLEVIAKDSSAKTRLISLEEFLAKEDLDVIKYMFNFRRTHVVMINGEKVDAYFEFPDMDLRGLDLSGIEFSAFIPGVIKDGKIEKSNINLNGTGALVNMSRIYYTDIIDHENEREYITDLSMCDFIGCDLYGRTQDEINYKAEKNEKYTFIGKEKLDPTYLRRRECHQTRNKELSDKVYGDLIDGKTISYIKENEEVDLTDYDLSNLSASKIQFIKNQLDRRKILIGFSNLVEGKLGAETKKSLDRTMQDAISTGDDGVILRYIGKYSGPQLKYLADYLVKRGRLFSKNISEYIDDERIIKKVVNKEFDRNPYLVPVRMYKYVYNESLVLALGKNKEIDERIVNYYKASTVDVDSILRQELAFNYPIDEKTIRLLLETNKVKNPNNIARAAEIYGMQIIPHECLTQTVYNCIIQRGLEHERKGIKTAIENPYKYLKRAERAKAQDVVEAKMQMGNEEFVESNFALLSSESKVKYMVAKMKSLDYDFIEKNFKFIPKDKAYSVFDAIYCMDAELARKIYLHQDSELRNSLANKIVRLSKDINTIKFVWRDASLAERQACIVRNGNKEENVRELRDFMQEAEKIHYGVMNKREARFFINRDKSTKEFVNLFESDASIKTIRLLIEEGIDINALIYIKKQKPKRVVEHAIKIKSFLRKEAIMYELLRAKVDVDFFVDWTDRFGDGYKGNFNESKAFKSLLKEVFLNKFLKEELAFSEEDILNLSQMYESYKMNFKDEDFSELNLKKEIFDLCGMTNYAFRENPKLLFTSSETYYARLMFFRELGIKITEKNFMKTLGLTNIQFAKEYGRMIVVKGNKKDEQYDKEVKRSLIKKYQMPKTLREIKRSLGDDKMIYIKEDRKNGKKIHVFNKENEFTFENARVLPAEQRDLLLELLTKLARKNAGQLDEEFEMAERERIAGEMLKRFQDARLTQKARIRTLYSTGGSLTSGTESEKDSMKTKGVKVEYLAIDINGVVILEPFGQLNNATLITPYTNDVERKLTEFGRKGVLDNGFYKIMHDGKAMPGYNYESDHILKILDMTIEDKEQLLKVLKDVREKDKAQYCGLRKVRRNYFTAKAVKDSNITKQEVLDIAKERDDKEGEAR